MLPGISSRIEYELYELRGLQIEKLKFRQKRFTWRKE